MKAPVGVFLVHITGERGHAGGWQEVQGSLLKGPVYSPREFGPSPTDIVVGGLKAHQRMNGSLCNRQKVPRGTHGRLL